eukprot:TRINITY_DN3564_c1_g3_i1.p1 TRINITY_DN3564_c1_g3~~TRINITY_DN3564_c1_g3_i1.p1  ORF type:complete len:802 (+),score=106.69 TRINITY_DN3564_c1_g3_i1:77-2482(+)
MAIDMAVLASSSPLRLDNGRTSLPSQSPDETELRMAAAPMSQVDVGEAETIGVSDTKVLLSNLQAEAHALTRARRAIGRSDVGSGRESPSTLGQLPVAVATTAFSHEVLASTKAREASLLSRSLRSPSSSQSDGGARLSCKAHVPPQGVVSVTAIQVEAATLARAHRALRGSNDDTTSAKGARAPAEGTNIASQVGSSTSTEIRHFPDVCPMCGSRVGIAKNVACARADGLDTSFHNGPMAARLDLLEALLKKAEPEAALATQLRHELEIERARSAELVESFGASKRLAEELYSSFRAQTHEFNTFVAKVRAAMAPANNTDATSRAVCERFAAMTTPATSGLWLRHEDDDRAQMLDRLRRERQAERRDSRREQAEERERLVADLRKSLSDEAETMEVVRQRSLSVSRDADEMRAETRARTLSLNADLAECRGELQAAAGEHEEVRSELSRIEAHALHETSVKREVDEHLLQAESEVANRSAAISEMESRLESQRADAIASAAAAVTQATSLAKQTFKSARAKRAKDRYMDQQLSGVRAISLLLKGVILSKLSDRRKKWQDRFVALVKPGNELKWSSDLKKKTLGRNATALKLKDVVRVEFGDRLPDALRPKHQPWHCFVLWSVSRSYCFWCNDASIVSAFVVGLSILSPMAPLISVHDVRLRTARSKLGLDRAARRAAILEAVDKAKRSDGRMKAGLPAVGILKGGVRSPVRRHVSWGQAETRGVGYLDIHQDDRDYEGERARMLEAGLIADGSDDSSVSVDGESAEEDDEHAKDDDEEEEEEEAECEDIGDAADDAGETE